MFRIGISGWRFDGWRGKFYPPGLAQKKELHYASRQLNSIEINGTFYALQSATSFKRWYDETPDDFVFSVKGNRYITHIRRLKDVKSAVGNFFGSGVLHLKQKLGPFLWQFPPNFLFYDDRIEEFFKMLPRTMSEATEVAGWGSFGEADFPAELKNSLTPLRHAMEVRHHSFENPDFIDLLRRYNIALVFADTAGKWPYMEDVTADFIYARLHGDEKLYVSGYGDPILKIWADRFKKWHAGSGPTSPLTITDHKPKAGQKDVYVYFDNDVKVRAPHDARRLRQMLKV